MIPGLMNQGQSSIGSIRTHGCYFMCLMAIVQDVAGKLLSEPQIASVFSSGKQLRFIKDNAIPLGTAGWWRAFIEDGNGVIQLAAQELGIQVKSGVLRDPLSPTPTGYPYTMIVLCATTQTDAGVVHKNWHYILGKVQPDLTWKETYDPGSGRFPRTNATGCRHWSVNQVRSPLFIKRDRRAIV